MRRALLLWVLLAGRSVLAQQVVSFTDSNLPLIQLDTRGQTILDDPKVACRLRITARPGGLRNGLLDAPTDYDGWAGVEVRGSSSQMFPKLGYGIELWSDSLASVQVDTALCGMPAEHDWILSASYSDKTLLRNFLAYNLATRMGHWAARVVPCELILNGQYQGVYLLMEKIKRGADRVPIGKLTPADTTGDRLTGGYIFKIDKATGSGGAGWPSRYAPPGGQGQTIDFLYDYPKATTIAPAQAAYLQSYVDSFEVALRGPAFRSPATGYARYADPTTFTDYLLLNEASRNVDGYRISTYLHKDRRSRPGGGRIKIGPAWDYDIAWHNADYCDGDQISGWAWQFNQVCGADGWLVPFWWARLQQDSTFSNATHCRWQALRQPGQPFATARLTGWLDSLATHLNEGQRRNFRAWPILGQYVWPNPQPIAASYAGEIANLKNWLAARLSWLDANLPGTCRPLAVPATALADAAAATLWPNPVAGTGELPRLTFALRRAATAHLVVLDAAGRVVQQSAPVALNAGVWTLPVPAALPPGFYAVRLCLSDGGGVARRLVVE